MTVQVLFFGATSSITGERCVEVELAEEAYARDVFAKMLADYPRLTSQKLLFSVNQQYTTGDEIICDGDEVAIFTAVSGG